MQLLLEERKETERQWKQISCRIAREDLVAKAKKYHRVMKSDKNKIEEMKLKVKLGYYKIIMKV